MAPAQGAGLVFDKAGNLYGTTSGGGTGGCFDQGGCGVVFELQPNGAEKILYAFKGGFDGTYPDNMLIRDAAGNITGSTYFGGGSGCANMGCGTVFRLAPDGSETVLHAFHGAGDGENPSSVTRDRTGNLYGTTIYACSVEVNCGNAYKLAPDGMFTVLHTFTVASGGAPNGGLLLDKAGHLFGNMGPSYLNQMSPYGSPGLANGSVYEITP